MLGPCTKTLGIWDVRVSTWPPRYSDINITAFLSIFTKRLTQWNRALIEKCVPRVLQLHANISKAISKRKHTNSETLIK
jgi:hypothetical protein